MGGKHLYTTQSMYTMMKRNDDELETVQVSGKGASDSELGKDIRFMPSDFSCELCGKDFKAGDSIQISTEVILYGTLTSTEDVMGWVRINVEEQGEFALDGMDTSVHQSCASKPPWSD